MLGGLIGEEARALIAQSETMPASLRNGIVVNDDLDVWEHRLEEQVEWMHRYRIQTARRWSERRQRSRVSSNSESCTLRVAAGFTGVDNYDRPPRSPL